MNQEKLFKYDIGIESFNWILGYSDKKLPIETKHYMPEYSISSNNSNNKSNNNGFN
jgi:hypothetical protein